MSSVESNLLTPSGAGLEHSRRNSENNNSSSTSTTSASNNNNRTLGVLSNLSRTSSDQQQHGSSSSNGSRNNVPQDVIHLNSDDEDDVIVVGDSTIDTPVENVDGDSSNDIQITGTTRIRGQPLTFGINRTQNTRITNPANSDSNNDDDDDELQIINERQIPPSEVRNGFTLFTPDGPQFQTDQNIRIRGIGRGPLRMGGPGRPLPTVMHGVAPLPPPTGNPPLHNHTHRHPRTIRTRNSRHTRYGNRVQVLDGSILEDILSGREPAIESPRLQNGQFLHAALGTLINAIRSNRNGDTFMRGILEDEFDDESRTFDSMMQELVFRNHDNDDDVPDHIMDRIRTEEENLENGRIDARRKYAKRMKDSHEEEAEENNECFTNNISNEEDSLCILCGVVLSEGISEDYEVQPLTFKESRDLIVNQGFKAPYQLTKKFTKLDIDLSKKIFFGRCGHVYCGRCVNNLIRVWNMGPQETKNNNNKNKNKRKRKKKIDFENIFPDDLRSIDFDELDHLDSRVCVHPTCKKKATKYFFRQLFI